MKSIQYKLIKLLLLTSTLPLVCVAVITGIFISRIAVNEAGMQIGTNLRLALAGYRARKNTLSSSPVTRTAGHPLL
jgi:hypothetical protein